MPSFTLFDGSDVARTLLDGESGFVAQTGSLATTGAAILASGAVDVAALGSIFSEDDAAISHNGESLELNVGPGGSVGSAEEDTVLSSFTGQAVVSNAGYLFSGEDALDLRTGDDGGDISILNTGVISGSSDGVVTNSGAGLTEIVNHGEIVGAAGGIDHLEGDAVLMNHGAIAGSDYGYDGADQSDEVHNFGDIAGGVFGFAGDDLVHNEGSIDAVDLGEGDDTYDGRGGSTLAGVLGGAGEDLLRGGGDDDDLRGGDDSDRLLGRGGDDALSGDRGGDALSGGRGDDELRGGGGADVFRFAAGSGFDTILDLRDSDDIDLTALGLRSFSADVNDNIRRASGGAVIDLSDDYGVTIFAQGVDADTLNARDFLI